MAIPKTIQDKMFEYQQVLSNRYPLSYTYYKISAGNSKTSVAISDLTPKYNILTDDDSSPKETSVIYTDRFKNNEYIGGSLWYHLFDSSSADLNIIIRIDNRGLVTDFQRLI
jgi:hypothetical protein